MFISYKYHRLRSDAVHNVQHLTRAYDICPSIRQVFPDAITYILVRGSLTVCSHRHIMLILTDQSTVEQISCFL